ncbi:hypothetical protein EX30DRAFT_347962 [Ascodesmis nigricans]|uniref:Uncharacterized protein n=1 Tax=Ascodesmis nigricans TaxID=341454 RepID=A0A4S2MZ32_9PEZI|nr:hypothetical protein EX30DRAFT_347962 [Ascodesmis nigricans]
MATISQPTQRAKRPRERTSTASTATTSTRSPTNKRQKTSLGNNDTIPVFAKPTQSARSSAMTAGFYDIPDGFPQEPAAEERGLIAGKRLMRRTQQVQEGDAENPKGLRKKHQYARKAAARTRQPRQTAEVQEPVPEMMLVVQTEENVSMEAVGDKAGPRKETTLSETIGSAGPAKKAKRGRPRKNRASEDGQKGDRNANTVKPPQNEVTTPVEEAATGHGDQEEEEEEDTIDVGAILSAAKAHHGDTPSPKNRPRQFKEQSLNRREKEQHLTRDRTPIQTPLTPPATRTDPRSPLDIHHDDDEAGQVENESGDDDDALWSRSRRSGNQEEEEEEEEEEAGALVLHGHESEHHEDTPPRRRSGRRNRAPATHNDEDAAVARYMEEDDREGSLPVARRDPLLPTASPSPQRRVKVLEKIGTSIDTLLDFAATIREGRFSTFHYSNLKSFEDEIINVAWSVRLPKPDEEYTDEERKMFPATLRKLDRYRHKLLIMQTAVEEVMHELRTKQHKNTCNAFARHMSFVRELISRIELIFRRWEYLDRDGKRWVDEAKMRAESVVSSLRLSMQLFRNKSPLSPRMLENGTAESVGEESQSDAPFSADELDDNEERDEDEDDDEEGALVLGDDAPVERVRVDAFGDHARRRTASNRHHRQGSIAEDNIPWSEKEQVYLCAAMKATMLQHGEILWSAVLEERPALQSRGWQACQAEAKRMRDLVIAAGKNVPPYLVKVD